MWSPVSQGAHTRIPGASSALVSSQRQLYPLLSPASLHVDNQPDLNLCLTYLTCFCFPDQPFTDTINQKMNEKFLSRDQKQMQPKAHKIPSNCFYKPCEDIKMSSDILHLCRVQKFPDDKWCILRVPDNFGKQLQFQEIKSTMNMQNEKFFFSPPLARP